MPKFWRWRANAARKAKAGATFPALFAMIARRHMHQYGTTREHLAAVAVKNHANGAKNPDAHMRKVITIEQAMAGKPIADPLTVYDCSLVSDGAASVVIAPLERAREFTDKPVRILGIAQTSDYVALDRKADITMFRAVQDAPPKRRMRWRVSDPDDIQFAEVHDCFTIAEIVAIEDLGFVSKGEGGPYTADGHTQSDGDRAREHERRLEIERTSGGRDGRGADLRRGAADSGRSRRAAGRAARHRIGSEPGRLRRVLPWSPSWGRHDAASFTRKR